MAIPPIGLGKSSFAQESELDGDHARQLSQILSRGVSQQDVHAAVELLYHMRVDMGLAPVDLRWPLPVISTSDLERYQQQGHFTQALKNALETKNLREALTNHADNTTLTQLVKDGSDGGTLRSALCHLSQGELATLCQALPIKGRAMVTLTFMNEEKMPPLEPETRATLLAALDCLPLREWMRQRFIERFPE